MKEMWDERYAQHELVYGEAPNSFFREVVDGLKPATLLLPGEGEGRNAIYAALAGWKVFAVDYSVVAKEKTLGRAEKQGLKISYEVADLSNWEFAESSVDLIALVFTHLDPEYRQNIHRKLAGYLKPGGTLALVAFSKEQLNFTSGGPKNPDWLYDMETLRHDFSGLDFTMLEKKHMYLDESRFHSGEASIIQMVATKN